MTRAKGCQNQLSFWQKLQKLWQFENKICGVAWQFVEQGGTPASSLVNYDYLFHETSIYFILD